MKRLSSCVVFALLACIVAAGCGGKKRPPAVSTGGGSTRGTAGGPSNVPVEPVNAGPDVAPVEPPGITDTDIPTDFTDKENGPLADIHFAFDQASLSDDARATLEKHALWLQSNRAARVRLEGHCDERGTVDYNLALGEQRARAAREYLVSLGVAADRLSTVSYGKEKPVDSGHDEAAWSRNRRAHFSVAR